MYTPEETQILHDLYQEGKTLEEIELILNRSVKSLRSKLVRDGLYIPPVKEKQSKSKKEILRDLEPFVNPTGLEGATKEALQRIYDKFRNEKS